MGTQQPTGDSVYLGRSLPQCCQCFAVSDVPKVLTVHFQDLVPWFEAAVLGRSTVRINLVYNYHALQHKQWQQKVCGEARGGELAAPHPILTSSVSDPPTMLSPRPILSLLISTVVSLPGEISHFDGSGGGSSRVVDWCLATDKGDNRSVEEGEALGETGIMARGSGLPRHKSDVAEDVGSVTRTSNVGRPKYGDMVWMDFGCGDFCGFSDESCGFGSNSERKD